MAIDDFDPKAWVDDFDAAGGVLSLAHDGTLAIGVVRARPDAGRQAGAMRRELERCDDRLNAVWTYIRKRSGQAA